MMKRRQHRHEEAVPYAAASNAPGAHDRPHATSDRRSQARIAQEETCQAWTILSLVHGIASSTPNDTSTSLNGKLLRLSEVTRTLSPLNQTLTPPRIRIRSS